MDACEILSNDRRGDHSSGLIHVFKNCNPFFAVPPTNNSQSVTAGPSPYPGTRILWESSSRSQHAFVAELGHHYGLGIEPPSSAKPRMIEPSIETTHAPSVHQACCGGRNQSELQ